VVVLFEEPLEVVAKDVMTLYGKLKSELEEMFGWKLDFRPTVILIKDRKTFQKMTGNDFFVAFCRSPKKAGCD